MACRLLQHAISYVARPFRLCNAIGPRGLSTIESGNVWEQLCWHAFEQERGSFVLAVMLPQICSVGSHHAADAAAVGSLSVRAILGFAANDDFDATDMQWWFTPCCDVLTTRRSAYHSSLQNAVSREDPAVQ